MAYFKNIALFILPLIVIGFFSCSEENSPTEPVKEKAVWEIDETYFGSNRILLNAKASDGRFIVAGVNILTVYDSSKTETHVNGFPANNSAINYKPAIGGPYVMYAGSGDIQFYLNSPVYWYGNQGSASFPYIQYFRLNEYDIGYTDKAHVPIDYYERLIGAFNNQDQYLTLISDTSSFYNGNVSFCLISLNPEESHSGDLSYLEVSPHIVRIPIETDGGKFLSQIGSYKEMFLVSFQELYVIDPVGNVALAQGIENRRLSDFFSFKDTLYAYANTFNELYYSNDKGYTWQLKASGFPYAQLHFFEFNGHLCFYVYSQIATVDLDSGIIEELDNAGLEGNEITSVNKYNGIVWVTTLTGMFTKDVSEFLTVKESLSKSFSNKIRVHTNK